jgi:hypothetical protein
MAGVPVAAGLLAHHWAMQRAATQQWQPVAHQQALAGLQRLAPTIERQSQRLTAAGLPNPPYALWRQNLLSLVHCGVDPNATNPKALKPLGVQSQLDRVRQGLNSPYALGMPVPALPARTQLNAATLGVLTTATLTEWQCMLNPGSH